MHTGPDDDHQGTVAALMAASRAFVGITARSLATLDADVTLPQFRALVVLATRGPQRGADISAELKVAPSTGTRMCERLVRKGLVRRTRTPSDRRVVRLRLTPAGESLVDEVQPGAAAALVARPESAGRLRRARGCRRRRPAQALHGDPGRVRRRGLPRRPRTAGTRAAGGRPSCVTG